MTRPVRRLGAAIVSLLLVAGCSSPEPYPVDAPPLTGTDLDGTVQDLFDRAGSVVLVPIWASWCGPCADEQPVLQGALERYGDDGLQVLGINMRDHGPSAREFVEEHGAAYPSVEDPRGTVAVGWGVTTLPVTFLVDRDGQVVSKHFGPVTTEWVDDVVAAEVGS